MNTPSSRARAAFRWDDPLLFGEQLTDEERLVRDAARDYCQDRLLPRLVEANRREHFHREILNEMGALGFLELVGIPHRIVIGERGLKEGAVEYQHRRDAEATKVPLAAVAAHLRERLAR